MFKNVESFVGRYFILEQEDIKNDSEDNVHLEKLGRKNLLSLLGRCRSRSPC